jgi:metal-dependent amidase/aminoacylase/carboxypeptidase family protein
MVNLMREHVPQETRIHYVITSGGKAPNVVPDYAEVYYVVLHPKQHQAKQIFERVVKIAKAAASGTETKMDYEIIRSSHDLIINKSLGEAMQKNLEKVGGVKYTAEETEFAKKSDSETPKLDEGIAVGAMGLDKVEAKEATGSGSVGGYSSPAMWAKSTKKKDWGPSRKTQIPGGGFVKVKKKCTKFPYCNQGDINALKITKNESVKEAIKNVAKNMGISENVIKTILEHEYEKNQKRNK